jgi:membrane protein
VKNKIGDFFHKHPDIQAFLTKVGQDNIGFLASAVSWTLLTSVVPIVVGLTAISGLILSDPSTQSAVVTHLSAALQGVLSPAQIKGLVKLSVQHTSVLGIIGLLGLVWGGSNVGGAISTVFQPIFHVRGRSIVDEKLIDIGMIFVFAVLLLVIIGVTSAGALLNRLVTGLPVPGIGEWVVATLISLLAAFLLFSVTYVIFPNTETRFKLDNVWPGAAIAAVLFQIMTYIWPIYSHFAHFQKYTAVLASLLLLSAWLYFFSVILILGAEFVSFGALREAKRLDRPIGPGPNDTVPQHGASNQDGIEIETRPRAGGRPESAESR